MNRLTYGIRFNGKHSYSDYGLFLSEQPNFGSPEPKIHTVDIPGRDSELDFSEAATGEVVYSNREMEFTFATMIPQERRAELQSELLNDIHGQVVEIIYDLDPDYHYTGRATVEFEDLLSWKMRVIIHVDAQPYKLQNRYTVRGMTPTEFTSETVLLGRGTKNQRTNSILTFGTPEAPALDLTAFTKLTFYWTDNVGYGAAKIQIVDGDGDMYTLNNVQAEAVDGRYKYEITVSNISGIDVDSVYRIIITNRSMVSVYAQTLSSASMTIETGMTVIPEWIASSATSVFINGEKFTLPAGGSKDYKMLLRRGENQIMFTSASDDITVQLSFQDGRL